MNEGSLATRVMAGTRRRTFLRASGALIGGIALGTQVTAATRTDRFIVETKGNGTADDLTVVHELPGVKFVVVEETEDAVEESEAVKDYAPDLDVELDDPDPNADAPNVEETSVSDEPLYPFQWDKQVLDVSTAHETAKGDGSRITIIDSGVAADHPDLEVNEGLSRNFTGDGLGSANPAGGYHGTHVAGIAAAKTDNEVGVAGTAPETDLVDCRVFSATGGATFGDILAAVVYSVSIDADAANLSLGAYPVPRRSIGSFYGKVLNSTMTYANKEGTALVVAAGNDAADLQHDKNFISLPNEGAQAVSVSATGPIGFEWEATTVGDEEEPPQSPANYTNFGTNAITVGAPGGDSSPAGIEQEDANGAPPWYYDLVLNTIAIPTYESSDGNITGIKDIRYTYGWVSGTSMAAPQVTGAVALMKSANGDLNANQVESILKRTASVPDGFEKTYYGSGFLDLVEAVEKAQEKSKEDDGNDDGNGNDNSGNGKGRRKRSQRTVELTSSTP